MLVNINWALMSGYSLQVEDMLKYIYGGKIENLEDKATKLLAAADQYDLKLLKKKCEELLCKSLNISNCLDYLILADMHSTDILKPLVIRLVRPLVLLNDTSNNVTLKTQVCGGEQQGGGDPRELEREADDIHRCVCRGIN